MDWTKIDTLLLDSMNVNNEITEIIPDVSRIERGDNFTVEITNNVITAAWDVRLTDKEVIQIVSTRREKE